MNSDLYSKILILFALLKSIIVSSAVYLLGTHQVPEIKYSDCLSLHSANENQSYF